jgi:type VI secretion system protein ImpM
LSPARWLVSSVAGWFGKIPALGDFATRRLPVSFVTPWDEWLSSELSELRAQWEDEWSARFRRAPTLCFEIDAGVVDTHAWQGVIVASHDRVGREFPLTLAQSDIAATGTVEWWAGLVATAGRALEPGCGIAEFDRLVEEFFAVAGQSPAASHSPVARHLAAAGYLPAAGRLAAAGHLPGAGHLATAGNLPAAGHSPTAGHLPAAGHSSTAGHLPVAGHLAAGGSLQAAVTLPAGGPQRRGWWRWGDRERADAPSHVSTELPRGEHFRSLLSEPPSA